MFPVSGNRTRLVQTVTRPTKEAMKMRVALTLVTIMWLLTITVGLRRMLRHESSEGVPGNSPIERQNVASVRNERGSDHAIR